MDEQFMLFLQDIPASIQGFVMDLDQMLTDAGSRREIKSAKSGWVSSYRHPKTDKALCNYVFRKTGVKMRIYATGVHGYESMLNDFPEKMKKDTIKSGDCKKLTGQNCSPTCQGGYTFTMDDVEYKKCKNMAFFYDLNEESSTFIRKMIEGEIG